jgi:AraC-like DNA-binding protein/quercetin dioxygenase-like cupin family protein
MLQVDRRALYQRFLPSGEEHAFVWKYAPATGGRRPRHFHSEPEVNLVVSGWARFGVGRSVVRVSAGEMITFPPGQDHALLEASSDLFLYAIGLEASYAEEVIGVRRESVVPLHVRLSDREVAHVVEQAGALVDRAGAKELGAELWHRCQWLGRHAAGAGRRPHVLTRRALELVATAPDLALDTLAAELRAHPSEVSRHFHADLGTPLVRYRTRLRLLEVIRLVDAGTHDLMAAASAAGFGSYSQCHRTFVSELGCGPRQFFSEKREPMQLAYAG